MIDRVTESKCTTAVTTSKASRACASVKPTLAYSGSVKLPIGWGSVPRVDTAPRTALVAATKPSWIACGTTSRCPVMSPAAKMWGTDVRR